MSDRTVIDCTTGQVTVVPFTPAEQAARDIEETNGLAQGLVQAQADRNGATIRDRLEQQLAALVNAADAIQSGTATAAQKDQALMLALRTCARLSRLLINRLDAAP